MVVSCSEEVFCRPSTAPVGGRLFHARAAVTRNGRCPLITELL